MVRTALTGVYREEALRVGVVPLRFDGGEQNVVDEREVHARRRHGTRHDDCLVGAQLVRPAHRTEIGVGGIVALGAGDIAHARFLGRPTVLLISRRRVLVGRRRQKIHQVMRAGIVAEAGNELAFACQLQCVEQAQLTALNDAPRRLQVRLKSVDVSEGGVERLGCLLGHGAGRVFHHARHRGTREHCGPCRSEAQCAPTVNVLSLHGIPPVVGS